MGSATTTEDTVGRAVQALSSAQALSPSDITDALASIMSDRVMEGASEVAVPEVADVISDEERQALELLPRVFAKVTQPGSPVPLSVKETDLLLEERTALATVEKMVKARKESIRVLVQNAIDAALLEAGEADEETPRDAHGWFLLKGEATGEHHGRFVRTVRKGTVQIDLDRLREMADDPDCDLLDHSDWLAMTRQTRVFDEAKAALALNQNPDLLRALVDATVTTGASTVLNQRKK